MARCEFSVPTAPQPGGSTSMRTPLRLKLLSLKPNKQQLILGRVTVSVETTAAAVPPAALNNSTSSANKIAVSNFTADATTAGGGTASTGISASMTSSEQLSGILRTAMLQIDTKVMIKIHTFFHVSCTRAPLYSLVYLLLVGFFFLIVNIHSIPPNEFISSQIHPACGQLERRLSQRLAVLEGAFSNNELPNHVYAYSAGLTYTFAPPCLLTQR